jgi:hypothetical protein
MKLSQTRLHTQHIATRDFEDAQDVVRHFGAMQAQDYAMAKWAIGCRMKNGTDELVEKMLDDGKIIRTHVLRPTWHFVVPEDLIWMLELSAPNIRRIMTSYEKNLGIDEKTVGKSKTLIAKSLENGDLERDILLRILERNAIKTDGYRGSHLLMHAELDGLICSGKRTAGKQTYGLVASRVPYFKKVTREDALAELAARYFKSHGPATLKDFAWWSGLSQADSKKAIASHDFSSETLEGQTYYFTESIQSFEKPSAFLLPAFDEFLIAYKGRSASIAEGHAKHALTVNGIFKPIVVAGDQVVATWKRTVKKEAVQIEILLLGKISKTMQRLAEKDAERFASFIGKKPVIIFKTA